MPRYRHERSRDRESDDHKKNISRSSSSNSDDYHKKYVKRKKRKNRSRSNDDLYKNRQDEVQHEEANERIMRPNSFVLAGLLRDQIRTNDRMDRQEVVKAEAKFREIDKSGRKVRLMTDVLTGKHDDDVLHERQQVRVVSGEIYKVDLPYECGYTSCFRRFATSQALMAHLKDHPSQAINSKQRPSRGDARKGGSIDKY
eukprot:GHVL01006362.1.p1 GENE.GHVL01006362.1~~GHVL01006362.1.p1  ORF type:complete len:199 (-),score=28.80 GHVL01006362.1:54-650(-)